MRHCDVSNKGDVVSYLADCTLATVSKMAMQKRRPKREFERQIRIAQKAVDWIRVFKIEYSDTRCEDVIENYGGEVAAWAKFYIED